MTHTAEQIKEIVAEAKGEAYKAAQEFFQTKLNGQDQFACGFAWVTIYKVDGRSKLGKAFKEAGVGRDYTGALQIWNPSGMGCQNIDTLEAGAQAAAEIFKKHGFVAYAGSRLD